LDDFAAWQSLDGKHHYPSAALGSISSTITVGQKQVFRMMGPTTQSWLKPIFRSKAQIFLVNWAQCTPPEIQVGAKLM
jgi:hypothetical protein